MARVTPAPSFQQFSGKPNKAGSTVFYPRHDKTFARIQNPVPYRYTPAQVLLTGYNRIATQAFSHITDEQRDTWKTYAANFTRVHMGQSIKLTDRECFIGVNCIRQINLDPLALVAPLIPINNFTFTLSDVYSLPSGPGIQFVLTHDCPDIHSSWFLCRASFSFPSSNRNARKADYRLAGSVDHISLYPVQQSPQAFYFPLTTQLHNENFFIHIQIMIFSSDYFQGIQLAAQAQVNTQDCLWRNSATEYIKYNPSPSSLDFVISSTTVAKLFANGNLSLLGAMTELYPADAPAVASYISYHPGTSQIRLAYKTKSSPGFKCYMSIDSSGNVILYGELYEFIDLTSYPETQFFHPYVNPRKCQFSPNKILSAMIYQVDTAPQDILMLREVSENVL